MVKVVGERAGILEIPHPGPGPVSVVVPRILDLDALVGAVIRAVRAQGSDQPGAVGDLQALAGAALGLSIAGGAGYVAPRLRDHGRDPVAYGERVLDDLVQLWYPTDPGRGILELQVLGQDVITWLLDGYVHHASRAEPAAGPFSGPTSGPSPDVGGQ